MVRLAALIMAIVALGALWALTADGEPPVDGLDGSVFASGSSTVEPITLIVAEQFARARRRRSATRSRARAPATASPSSATARPTSTTHRGRSSRARSRPAPTNGVEFVELLVAFDGLTVITSAENDAVDCLSFLDLYALLGPESQGIRNWADADALADELAASWDRVRRVGGALPGRATGGHRARRGVGHVRHVRRDRHRADRRRARHRGRHDPPGLHGAPERQRHPGGHRRHGHLARLGRLGLRGGVRGLRPAARDRRRRRLRRTHRTEASADGSYPIARPLFVYVNPTGRERNAALRGFIDFYLTDAGMPSARPTRSGYVASSTPVPRRAPPARRLATVGHVAG